MNNIIGTLIESQLKIFVENYKNTAYAVFYDEEEKKLIHPGEYGGLRESFVRDLLKNFLPEPYGISQGFVVSPNGKVSNQCDVIVYSTLFTPIIQTPEHQRFFPVESVVAVGEVKSELDSRKLRDALLKLTKIKQMRADLPDETAIAVQFPSLRDVYAPHQCPVDQLGTFIFAEKISCSPKTVANIVREVVKDTHPSYRVNLVTSIDNYCTGYKYKGVWMYPTDPQGNPLTLAFVYYRINNYAHLKLFLIYLLQVIKGATVLYPELTYYFGDLEPLEFVEECDLT